VHHLNAKLFCFAVKVIRRVYKGKLNDYLNVNQDRDLVRHDVMQIFMSKNVSGVPAALIFNFLLISSFPISACTLFLYDPYIATED
jgi:hypothetical protein